MFWDVYTFGPGAEIFELKNKGGLESLWDFLSCLMCLMTRHGLADSRTGF